MKVDYDVAIIGSGISSLTSAILLAQRGYRVGIFEQHYKFGGYLHSFKKFGKDFDTGGHYVGAMGKGQYFRALLIALDIYDENLFVPLDPDGFDVFDFGDRNVSIPCGYKKLFERLSKIFPKEKEGLRLFLNEIQRSVQSLPTYSFSDSADYEEQIRGLDRTLEQVASAYIKDQRLKDVFYSYCALHGVDAKDVPFALHCAVLDSLIIGPYGFSSGAEALANAYIAKIKSLGGELFNNSLVEKIIVENKEVRGLELSGGRRVTAKYIISGIHPKNVLNMLSDEALPRLYKRRIESAPESVGIMGLYAKVDRSLDISPLKNYYYFSSGNLSNLVVKPNVFSQEIDVMFLTQPKRGRSIDEDFSLSIHAPCNFKNIKQWQNSKFLERPQDYKEYKELLGRQIMNSMNQRLPGFERSVIKVEISTPLSNLHYNPSPEGAAYGIYHSKDYAGLKSLNMRTKVKNLVLTGQNFIFPGLYGAAVSGLRAAGLIVGLDELMAQVRHHISYQGEEF